MAQAADTHSTWPSSLDHTNTVEATGNLTLSPTYVDTSFANAYAAKNLTMSSLTTADQEIFMDNIFDSLDWSTSWADQDYLSETPSLGWDHNTMNGCGGSAHFGGYFNSDFVETPAQLGMDMSQYGVPSNADSTNEHYACQ